jgi:hypothetical protein
MVLYLGVRVGEWMGGKEGDGGGGVRMHVCMCGSFWRHPSWLNA